MKVGDIYQKTVVHKAPKIRQASFWALGNIFCVDNEILEFFFTKNPLIFELLIKTIQNDTFFKVFSLFFFKKNSLKRWKKKQ